MAIGPVIGNATILRFPIILGPNDHSGRLDYLARRISQIVLSLLMRVNVPNWPSLLLRTPLTC